MNFEQKLKSLEKITELMRNEIPLEESIENFEKGMKIAKELEEQLTSYEKRVEILISNGVQDHFEDFK